MDLAHGLMTEYAGGVSLKDGSNAAVDEKIDCCRARVLIYYRFNFNLQHFRHIISNGHCSTDVGIGYRQPV